MPTKEQWRVWWPGDKDSQMAGEFLISIYSKQIRVAYLVRIYDSKENLEVTLA